ncbi:MAG: hypothetical protein QM487_12040, partial [Candidatus Marithrix sp.]
PPPGSEETDSELPPPGSEETDSELPPPGSEETDSELPPPGSEETDSELPPPGSEETDSELPPPGSEETDSELPLPKTEETDSELPIPETEETDSELPLPKTEEIDSELPLPETEETDSELPIPKTEETNSELPPPERDKNEFEKNSENIVNLDAERVAELEPQMFAAFDAEMVKKIPPEALTTLTPEQMAEFDEESINGITVEQFKQIPETTINGLTAENMPGLSIDVIANLTSDDLQAINTEEFQQTSSNNISKFMTNIDVDNVDIIDLEEKLPPDWEMDLDSGKLTPPIGAKFTLQTLSPNVPDAVKLPEMPNLKTGFSAGGKGTSVENDMQVSLTQTAEKENIQITIHQDEIGILNSTVVINGETIEHSFMIDTDYSVQVDTNDDSSGLSIGTGGFYNITSLDGQQYKIIPAPKDPTDLAKVIGGEISLGENGEVLMKNSDKTLEVVIFDPLIIPKIDDLELRKRVSRKESSTKKTITYSDGSSQTIRPTLLSPNIFIEELLKFDGVEKVIYNADGTFAVKYYGDKYVITPSFEIQNETVDEEVDPSITSNGDGKIKYSITIPNDDTQTTRSSESYEVLTFDSSVESDDSDSCVEISEGEYYCDDSDLE